MKKLLIGGIVGTLITLALLQGMGRQTMVAEKNDARVVHHQNASKTTAQDSATQMAKSEAEVNGLGLTFVGGPSIEVSQ